MSGIGPGVGGAGPSAGLLARLTPYQVGLCSLLARYVQSEQVAPPASLATRDDPDGDDEELEHRRLFELLRREVQAARGPQKRGLRELGREMHADPQYALLWGELMARLRSIDSPDALFDVFHDLENAVERELTAASPMHANGIFGHFARCCLLAFREASFEATVKLYDAVREHVEEVDGPGADFRDVAMSPSSGQEGSAASRPTSLSTVQMEQLAKGLMRDLPLSFGRVPFPVVDAALSALQGKLPFCHVVHFLRYVNSSEHRFVDDATSCLQAFHDGHQQRGLAEMRTATGWATAAPVEDGLPELIQHASLALAGLHSEMRHLDDALQAAGESIRAAQEASDGGCLCACLYILSLILLQAGFTGKAFAMMRRCLQRADALGLPALQSLCCLGIAHTLSVQPSLSDRRKRALMWRESASIMSTETQPTAVLRAHSNPGPPGAPGQWVGGAGGAGGFGAGGGTTGAGAGSNTAARVFGFAGSSGGGGTRSGLSVLAQLLGHTTRDDAGASAGGMGSRGGADTTEGESAACRDALAHVTLASQLSTQAGALGEARPKVLLCQADVARLFGLHQLTTTSCQLVLDVYHQDMVAEDRALALCQLAMDASRRSVVDAQPLLRNVAQQLPHAGHLWAHVVGPQLVQTLIRAGECAAASTVLFQAVGALRAAPHSAAISAAQRLRLTSNAVRLYHRQLLPACKSAREAIEAGARVGTPGDLCGHLLCLADAHLIAHNPVGALGPCLRCLSIAENARLLHYRAEAVVRIARVKFDMQDFTAALQLVEEATPQLGAGGSMRLRGEALLLQADVLFALNARNAREAKDPGTKRRLLREVVSVLRGAVDAFEAVAELSPLRRCRYLLARACHELGDTDGRDVHAKAFRRISAFLDGVGTWADLGLATPKPDPRGHEVAPNAMDVVETGDSASRPQSAAMGFAASGGHAGRSSVGATTGVAQGAGRRPNRDGGAAFGGENASGAHACLGGGDGVSISASFMAPCPALAQLLAMAEATHSGLGRNEALQRSGGQPTFGVSSRGGRTSTVVGEVHAFYPMAAAVLGA